MMKIICALCCLLILGTNSTVSAKETKESKESQTLVVSNEREGVYLYATPNFKNNRFTNFQVKIGKETVETFGWESSMREERQPELHVVDLNHDGQNEIVVIITKGTGTWVVVKEAHILQKVDTPYGKAYEEMDIDDPVHTVERDFDITATDKTILVRGRGRQWKGTNPCGETYSHHSFPLHQSVNWKMEGENLVADVGVTLTHNCVPFGFRLTYGQKGEIYVAKQVEVNL